MRGAPLALVNPKARDFECRDGGRRETSRLGKKGERMMDHQNFTTDGMNRRRFGALLGGAAAAASLSGGASWAQQNRTIALVGGMLISGLTEPPVHDATIIIRGDRIVEAGPSAIVKAPAGATVIDTNGQTMMPGLIDAHAHLFMVGYGDEADWFKWLETPAGKKYSIEKIMELSGWQMLMSGITGVIDLGGTAKDSVSLRDRVNKGEVAGPRMVVAGPLVCRQAFGGFPAAASAVIKSPEEGAATVERLKKEGCDVIKCHSGLTREDYFAIVRAARANRMKVHAHLYDEASIRNAFDAGVDVYQHMGSAGYPTYPDDLVRKIAESGRPIVLTAAHRSWIYPDTVSFPERLQDPAIKAMFPPDIWAATQDSFKHWQSEGYFTGIIRQMKYRSPQVKQLIASAAVMGVGTDSGTPMNFNHDGLIREMKCLVDEGLPILECIADATRVNARIMSKPDTGTIEPGQFADIIVAPGDPVYSQLNNLFNLSTVIKNGVIYKRDGKPTMPMPR